MKIFKFFSRLRLVLIVALLLFGGVPLMADEDADEDSKAPPVPMEQILSYEEQVPAFRVKTRKENLEAYPCSDCHLDEKPNPKERELKEEHADLKLKHGEGRFWCLTCHHETERNYLRSMKNNLIDFDRPDRLCGQCHFQRQKDWLFGGHGKRFGTWEGVRQMYLCTECHNPHDPTIKPQPPNPPPQPRKGLLRPPSAHPSHHLGHRVWERQQMHQSKEESHGK
ncbi:cytochrome C [Deltaproteobacteria bacterium TL4]